LPNPFRLFVDLDGVVADWLGRAIQTFGLNTDDSVIADILGNDARGLERIVSSTFMWGVIDAGEERWWDEIEPYPWAKDLWFSCIDLVGVDNVCFLTQPSWHGASAHGKTKWIRRYFDTENFLLGKPKHLCANRYSFLIDDTPKKIAQFEADGGNGVLFPNAFKVLYEEKRDCFPKSYVRGERMMPLISALLDGIKAKIAKVCEEDGVPVPQPANALSQQEKSEIDNLLKAA
jgi:5'(3')-deoxyribonucleotidase